MTALPLFPTSVVGSMPRPAWVRRLINDDENIEDADRVRWMDSAIRSVVALQEAAGLDVVTDGEWGRKSYIGVIAELADGFELSTNPADGRPWTIVTDRLAPKHAGFIAAEVEETVSSRSNRTCIRHRRVGHDGFAPFPEDDLRLGA